MERRSLFQLATAAALLRQNVAAQPAPPQRRMGLSGNAESFPGSAQRATVSLAGGNDRRKNVYEALKAIDKDLQAKMKGKKYAVIKPTL